MSQLIPKSPIQSRAAYFLSKAYAKTTANTSKNIREIMSAVRRLIDSIGWTTLVVKPMLKKELPYADDYKGMISETRHDISTIHNSVPQLSQQGLSIANFGSAQKEAISELVSKTEKSVNLFTERTNTEIIGHYIGTYLNEEARSRSESISDTLSTANGINISQSTNINYDNDSNLITLQRKTDVDHTRSHVPFVDIFLGNSLTGLPGNTVEVFPPTTSDFGITQTPTVIFTGESALNADPSSMFDGNQDTVFEFERISLDSENQPLVKLGDSYIYSSNGEVQNIPVSILPDTWTVSVTSSDDDGTQKTQQFSKVGIPASPDNKGLYCKVLFTAISPKPINIIEVDPYIPSGMLSGIPIHIESITVTSNTNEVIEVTTSKATTASGLTYIDNADILGKTSFMLPRTVIAKTVQIIIRQFTPYDMYAGHNYIVTTVSTNKKKTFLGFTTSNKTKITKPRLKTQDEQYAYDKEKTFNISSTTASIGYAIGGPAGAAIGWVIGSLFGSKTTQKVLKTERGVDVFKAKRWQIGIRNLLLKQVAYEETGTIVTNPITFAADISNVSVKVFADYDNENGTLVTCDVSDNNGKNWYPVDIVSGKYTPLQNKTNSVTVRFNLSRSNALSSDLGLTPIVYGYTVEGYE